MSPGVINGHDVAWCPSGWSDAYAVGVSRWKPNARARLVDAAVDLFAERGYGSVTVSDIAQSAELTKRTFSRQVADKREVSFGGQDDLRRATSDAIAGPPTKASPPTAVVMG